MEHPNKFLRTPFQGVWNIIRFNWHFYLLSIISLIVLLVLLNYLPLRWHLVIYLLGISIIITSFISLFVSYYVYDYSNLYDFNWLDKFELNPQGQFINVHAGFDETSILIKGKFEKSDLKVFDFYDPALHTEVSIKRARKAYPPYPNTQSIQTSHIPMKPESVDTIFLLLAAHEIRNTTERIAFFEELKRILKPNGQIIITEHLRDIPNFLAYNIGFFHFYSKPTWYHTFKHAKFRIKEESTITPFIKTFCLIK